MLAATLAVDAEVEVTGHNPMTPILETKSTGSSWGGAKSEIGSRTKMRGRGSPKEDESSLKRNASKRRSL